MNINNLRTNYTNLTMLQRLALADSALGREDDSEAIAIKNASPKVHYSQPDFVDLYDEILRIRMCNLVIRLGYVINFDHWFQTEVDFLMDIVSDSKREKRISGNLKLAAYLYVRATDSWKAINDELGLRQNFDDEIGQHLFAIELLRAKDKVMRSIAFSETEAQAFVQKETGITEFRTTADEIEGYREILELKKA